jgi:DNA invertase Pin-like site-specific DNA recombinase
MSEKITVIGYGRSSAGRQNVSSPDDQRSRIQDYAASLGMDLVGYHSDEGAAGAPLLRPGLQALIQDVETGRVDVVIVEGIDRLARDERDLRYLEELFARNGVTLHTLSGGGGRVVAGPAA